MIFRIAPALVAAAVITFAGTAGAAEPTAHVYALAAQNGSGEVGTVTLTAVGEKTRVDLALVGAADVAQPAHIHEGSCAKLNPKPKFPLTTVVNGLSTTTVDAPIATLVAGGFAVNVHKSTSDIPAYVACGDLSAKK
jgi:Cu/Zn superoxide dismutase